MLRRILLLIIFYLFYINTGLAEIFVVSSNADSGPGTLREALTKAAANGVTDKDYIRFNLPDLSEVGRTITIQTRLPDITSNLIIDASTQPGQKLGVSSARVSIICQVAQQNFSGLKALNCEYIEIYSLYIKNMIITQPVDTHQKVLI